MTPMLQAGPAPTWDVWCGLGAELSLATQEFLPANYKISLDTRSLLPDGATLTQQPSSHQDYLSSYQL